MERKLFTDRHSERREMKETSKRLGEVNGAKGEESLESYDYVHPLGILTLVLDHTHKELFMVSFTPCMNIDSTKVTSIDWYFKDGKFTGWGTGQEGWKKH